MKESFYGNFRQTQIQDDIGRYVEEISIRGFTIIPDLFSPTDLIQWRQKIDSIYDKQENDIGREELISIQELDTCRAPLLYDFECIKLATQSIVLSLVKHFLVDWFILNLQNVTINRPGEMHHQSSWHRDIPYQNYVISRPLAINAILAIDDFSELTGGTQVIPFTHKTEVLPSDAYIEANRAVVSARAGSMIVFDSMLFHRAGTNQSHMVRRGVNHLYTVPIMKQQYDFPRALKNCSDLEPSIARLLGFTCQVPLNDREWRGDRAKRRLNLKTLDKQ